MNRLFNFISYKIFNIFYYFAYKINYNEKLYINYQENKFFKFNLNRNSGLLKLNQLKILYNFLENPSSSEHQIIFSALSLQKNNAINNILEIGTYDGSNAFLLSKLFPSASITTIDLKDDNQDFLNFYNRGDPKKLEKFIKKRNQILEPIKKISFVQKNSINLINENKKFDLIYSSHALEHIIDPLEVFYKFKKYSKNSTKYFFEVPNGFNQKEINPPHTYYYTVNFFKKIFKARSSKSFYECNIYSNNKYTNINNVKGGVINLFTDYEIIL